MRTLKDLLIDLTKIADENPEALKMPIVFGTDIGKATRRFENVTNKPKIGHFCEDMFMTEKELNKWNKDEDENDKLNAVLIN